MNQDIENLKQSFQAGSDYGPYIESIVFPYYKSLSPSSEIRFEFPLTLLVGKNGTNKSSILHAIYGCPEDKSTGEYWFTTHLDPIDRKDGERASYFYRYKVKDTGEKAEVLMSRIKSRRDVDYWEPSRPVLKYGMKPFVREEQERPGKSNTRWNAINKEVIYLDFRAEISAFDKAFYKDVKNRPKYRNKLRKQSKLLKEAIEDGLNSKIWYGKERISKNHIFTAEQLEYANEILGNQYREIIYIEHDFYLSESFSVYIRKGEEENYSEAFAGSGETSAIRLIYAIDNAPKKSLVLLDEPETSLHIEAQYRLKDFILSKIKEKKLQVVISTHSPFFASGLPDCAIKVLIPDPLTKKIKIINSSPADESSFYLGQKRADASKATIFVEDKLCKALVMHVSKMHLTESQQDKLYFDFLPGGVTTMLNFAASEMLRHTSSSACFLFDGDQEPNCGIPNPLEIPESDNNRLEEIMKETFGFCPSVPRDSNKKEQKIEFLRNYLRFAREHFHYLPCVTPEDLIVENHEDLDSCIGENAKIKLKEYALRKLESTGEVDSNSIFFVQRSLLSDIPKENSTFVEISKILVYFSQYAF